ncbi:MAG: hypothetical protein RMJ87_03080 [Cytophagales bacterium]|nr:hypothetical protein [Bernardetiaceae bacterium]MDW8203990.1 hypothetical protein [Cytophagales bacterium]
MLTVIEKPDYKIAFDEAHRMLVVTDMITRHVSNEEVKEIIGWVANAIRRYRPLYYLGDDTQRNYVFSAEIQKWVAETMLSACIAAGMKKFALVQPQDLIAGLSNEQTADEIPPDIPIAIGFFSSVEEAKQWLLSDASDVQTFLNSSQEFSS